VPLAEEGFFSQWICWRRLCWSPKWRTHYGNWLSPPDKPYLEVLSSRNYDDLTQMRLGESLRRRHAWFLRRSSRMHQQRLF